MYWGLQWRWSQLQNNLKIFQLFQSVEYIMWIKISNKKEILDEAKERGAFRVEDLKSKKSELDEIVAETQAQEEKLEKKSLSMVNLKVDE